MTDWATSLVTDDDAILEIARSMRRVAVLGVKPESRASAPAHYVAKYLHDQGVEMVPVPVYYPEVTHVLGREVVRDLTAVGRVDVVDARRVVSARNSARRGRRACGARRDSRGAGSLPTRRSSPRTRPDEYPSGRRALIEAPDGRAIELDQAPR